MIGLPRDPADRALAMVAEAARLTGFDASGARVLRVRSSVHVELPSADVVARVEEPGGHALAERQVRIASVLAAQHAPVARLVRPEIQPLMIGGGAVTLWRTVRPVGVPTLEAVGRAVRAIHETTCKVGGVPEIDPIGQIAIQLEGATGFGATVLAELQRRADRLSTRWRDAIGDDPLGNVVVHGDPHLDNAVMTASGLVMLDLEDAGFGPASWDFVPLAVGIDRYGLPAGNLDRFIAGYGSGPADWPGLRVMCDVYELLVTSWAVRCGSDSPRMAREAEVRVAGLLDGNPTPWTLL
jgi:hypothetical protein